MSSIGDIVVLIISILIGLLSFSSRRVPRNQTDHLVILPTYESSDYAILGGVHKRVVACLRPLPKSR